MLEYEFRVIEKVRPRTLSVNITVRILASLRSKIVSLVKDGSDCPSLMSSYNNNATQSICRHSASRISSERRPN